MSAIFISYTGRDDEGDAWADRLSEWFREWGYGFFRDKDHSHGVKAGDDWRKTLYGELSRATAMVCLCSKQYDSSPWCVGEVAIAVEKGKTVIPIQLGRSGEDLKSEPLPLLLQVNQAILVADALDPSPEQLADVKKRLRRTLQKKLNWRDLQDWDSSQPPYPGLPAFEAHQAPVFFGRDKAIEVVVQRLSSIALNAPGFLLLLGASGYGKSSLVRAGVVPRLRADPGKWLPLRPFAPKRQPFKLLSEALQEAGVVDQRPDLPADPAHPEEAVVLQQLQSVGDVPVVLIIDQFEELLVDGNQQGERFLAFLQTLLSTELTQVIVLATMRTDFLAMLQSRWSELLGLASTVPLKPVPVADYGELITGPAKRADLSLQPGLLERLVADSKGEDGKGQDALPLLAFTLEKLWEKRQERGGPLIGGSGERWDLTVADYEALEGVDGAVRSQAELCWNPATGDADVAMALRDAFLRHLVSVNNEGKATKRAAMLTDLNERSRPILERMVRQRLLVRKEGTVEIAHEALLRTWEPLKQWIDENKEELLQCLRVKRLADDLKPTAAERQRRQALEQLAALAAAGGSEQLAVRKEAKEPLSALLAWVAPVGAGSEQAVMVSDADREDAALVLALIGAEEPLRQCLANAEAPPPLRRRAAESLGLLARRSGDGQQRQRIAAELEGWLRSEALDVRIEVAFDPANLGPALVQRLVEQSQREVAEALQQAVENGQLPAGMEEEQLQQIFQNAVQERLLEHVQALRKASWADGTSPGWKEHDARLPLLQGASRGLQLAASPALPLLGDGPGLVVPMLTLTALEEGEGLHIFTEVVPVPVWQLPLPGGEQLELVQVPAGTYEIGSPEGEEGRTSYSGFRSRCDPSEVNVEVQRMVQLQPFALVRHPISQGQWRAVVEALPAEARGNLKPGPGTFRGEDLWERYGQPGGLPVDSVSWNAAVEWLQALNGWLAEHWPACAEQRPGIGATPAQLALPSESQWEAACRGSANQPTPFHFGATLDPSWARYDASYTYGKGRRGEYLQRPVPIGFFGLVNTYGLAELHGQLMEWCGDQWHRDPVAGAPLGGGAMEGVDPGLAGDKEQRYRLLRGGSWFDGPRYCRAAFRNSSNPAFDTTNNGLRPCCPSPPGSLLGA